MNDFEQFVDKLIADRYRTAEKLAAAIEMTSSALGRGVKKGTLSVENCLRLAEISGEPPSQLLRLAGKGDDAALIERLYGPSTMTPADRALLEDWQAIPRDMREHYRAIIARTAEWERERAKQVASDTRQTKRRRSA
jgi:hypothetical protein